MRRKRRDEQHDPRLHDLLSAAGAPGRGHELRGEADAVAGFRQEYRPRDARKPRRKRRLATVAVAALLAAGAGGTAFAANTGHLPAPVQTWFDRHKPPASAKPDKSPISTMSAQQSPRVPQPTPKPSAGPTTPDACRAWVAHRTDPKSRPVTGDERQELSTLAGGEKAIDDYCDRLLAVPPSSSPATHPSTGRKASPSSNKGGSEN